jgi:hypothetical protein
MERIILIDCVYDMLQSAVTYVYIGSRTQLFESDKKKIFPKQTISQTLTRLSVLGKPDTAESKTVQYGFCDISFWIGFIPSLLLDTL